MDLKEKFTAAWKAKFAAGVARPILLAVSGGIDSMVLARLFLDSGVSFAVAHCNFHLRGEESDADARFVEAWCTNNSIPFFTKDFQTADIAEASRTSIQTTARNLRYEWFEIIRNTAGFGAIATAHHADDNAETMLMNLCRGTGIAGLHGIPERNGFIIRPLLFALREEIVAFATKENIQYREDSSNKKDNYLRNALRHHIMPLLAQEIPGAVLRIKETSERVGEAEYIYKQAIEKERKKLVEQRGHDFYIPIKLLMHRKPLATICFELFKPFGFVAAQTTQIMALLTAETGRHIASPSHRVLRNRDFLIVTTIQTTETDLIVIEEVPFSIATANGVLKASLKTKPEQLDLGLATVFIDYDKLSFPLVLRRWREGDYFYPLGMGMKKKKLSRYLIDQKIPLHEKQNIWVLESGKRVVWIVGKRMDERFKVAAATSQYLKLSFVPL